jgi:hypothetical protein
MIRSSCWQALIAVGAVAASVTVDAQQSPARCRFSKPRDPFLTTFSKPFPPFA